MLVWIAVLIACNDGPEYFVEREGQQEVVGSDNPADSRQPAARKQDAATPLGASRRGIMQPSQSRTVDDPVTAGLLPPVLERYDHVAERGRLLPEDCPDGTKFVDERKDRGLAQYCILETDGVRHGPAIRWFGTNRVQDVGPYIAGKRNGWWIQWKKNGQRGGAWRYVNGNPVEGEASAEEGTP